MSYYVRTYHVTNGEELSGPVCSIILYAAPESDLRIRRVIYDGCKMPSSRYIIIFVAGAQRESWSFLTVYAFSNFAQGRRRIRR